MKVAVIGAGAAGLACARRLKEANIEFVVFEQTENIGGTWVYDERTGNDEYGIPIHTSMYKSLRTNLPKEVMGFPDYPILTKDDRSYLTAKEILEYLQSFAKHFDIISNIKLRYCVMNVNPTLEKLWSVTVKNIKNGIIVKCSFDAVMVCNGHYNTPYIPTLKNEHNFRGKILHSHDYRTAEAFRKENVVVVGAGPSGLDIALDISSEANKVILSHHLVESIGTKFPDNFVQKPDIMEVDSDKVSFEDRTTEKVDTILYCTGYRYNFPFLAEECGVKVDNNYVHPLYKHLISIQNPTLCFIGLPFYVCANSMFDLQIRFFLKYLNKQIELPTKEEMLENERKEMTDRRRNGLTLRQSHLMGYSQHNYYSNLAKTADIEGIPLAMSNLHNESSRRFLEDLVHYREDKYKMIDEETFIKI